VHGGMKRGAREDALMGSQLKRPNLAPIRSVSRRLSGSVPRRRRARFRAGLLVRFGFCCGRFSFLGFRSCLGLSGICLIFFADFVAVCPNLKPKL